MKRCPVAEGEVCSDEGCDQVLLADSWLLFLLNLFIAATQGIHNLLEIGKKKINKKKQKKLCLLLQSTCLQALVGSVPVGSSPSHPSRDVRYVFGSNYSPGTETPSISLGWEEPGWFFLAFSVRVGVGVGGGYQTGVSHWGVLGAGGVSPPFIFPEIAFAVSLSYAERNEGLGAGSKVDLCLFA